MGYNAVLHPPGPGCMLQIVAPCQRHGPVLRTFKGQKGQHAELRTLDTSPLTTHESQG